jgi:hypothetical protein
MDSEYNSLGTLVSSTNKTDCHDITEILLKVVLNTILIIPLTQDSIGGGKIKSYWVDKREHGHDNWTRVNMQLCLTNILNIPNLIEDKRYEFRVFAENEAGMSKPINYDRIIFRVHLVVVVW